MDFLFCFVLFGGSLFCRFHCCCAVRGNRRGRHCHVEIITSTSLLLLLFHFTGRRCGGPSVDFRLIRPVAVGRRHHLRRQSGIQVGRRPPGREGMKTAMMKCRCFSAGPSSPCYLMTRPVARRTGSELRRPYRPSVKW